MKYTLISLCMLASTYGLATEKITIKVMCYQSTDSGIIAQYSKIAKEQSSEESALLMKERLDRRPNVSAEDRKTLTDMQKALAGKDRAERKKIIEGDPRFSQLMEKRKATLDEMRSKRREQHAAAADAVKARRKAQEDLEKKYLDKKLEVLSKVTPVFSFSKAVAVGEDFSDGIESTKDGKLAASIRGLAAKNGYCSFEVTVEKIPKTKPLLHSKVSQKLNTVKIVHSTLLVSTKGFLEVCVVETIKQPE